MLVLIERMAWGGAGLGGLPDRLTLALDGIRVVPVSENYPFFEFLGRIEAGAPGAGTDAAFELQIAGETLSLRGGLLDFGAAGRVALEAEIGGLSTQEIARLPGMSSGLTLRQLQLEVTANGLFETVLAPPLLNMLLITSDAPADAFAGAVAEASRIVDAIDAAALALASREAVQAVLDSLPHPQGTLTVSYASPTGLSVAQVILAVALNVEDPARMVSALLEPDALSVTWRPQGAPE